MKDNQEFIDIRSFAEMVSRAVSEELGGSCQVKLQEVIKNNGIILQGMVILTDSSNLSPTIYLNPFLEEYGAGTPMVHIVSEILKIYHRDVPRESVDMSFFRDFEKVSPGICYRVVNRERNRVLLEHIPHVDFLDLSICFFYSYQSELLGSGSILIYNSHLDAWNGSTETLMKLAQENTPRLYPQEIHSMHEIIEGFAAQEDAACERKDASCERKDAACERKDVSCERKDAVCERKETCMQEDPMKVLSNHKRIYGATCMIYPGALRAAAQSAGENLFILPSSVHEVILLPESAVDDRQFVRDMVREINATQVEPEEVLSGNLYFFDLHKNRIEIFAE